MITSVGETLNGLSDVWAHYMLAAILDATIGLALVWSIWFVTRRRVPPRWSYLLFLLVPLKLLVSFDAPILPAPTALQSVSATGATETPLAESAIADHPDSFTPASQPLPRQIAPSRTADADQSTRVESVGTIPTVSTLLMVVWAAIVALMVSRFAWNQRRLSQLLRDAKPIVLSDRSIDLGSLLESVGMRGSVTVLQSDTIDVPAVAGLLRPRIVLPSGLFASLEARQIECILAHELAHLKWYDLWVSLLERLVRIIHFANPAVWLAAHFAHVHREIACDDAALAAANMDRRACGATLLRVLQFAQRQHRHASPAIALFERTGLHRRRLQHIMTASTAVRRTGLGLVALLLLATVVVLPNLRAAPVTDRVHDTAVADEQAGHDPADEPTQQPLQQQPLIQIKAEGPLVMKNYDIGKLLHGGSDADSLVELITSSILPDKWDSVGGPGTIKFDRTQSQLQTFQCADGHQAIDRLLTTLAVIADQRKQRRPGDTAPPQAYKLFQTQDQVACVYTVPSLLFADPRRNDPRWADYDALIELTTRSVAPDCWDEVGGPGSIEVWEPGESLVIVQTPDNQQQIEKLYGLLHTVPSINSGQVPKSSEPSPLCKQTAQMSLANGQEPQIIELETKIYPLHDLLPAQTNGTFRTAPRTVGMQQLGFWLWKKIIPEQLPEVMGMLAFRTKGVLLLTSRPAVHERAVHALADLRNRLQQASAEQRSTLLREVFAPAFSIWATKSEWYIRTSHDLVPDQVYLYGACGADQQLSQLGPLTEFVNFQLIDSDVTDRGLAEIAKLGKTVQLTVWSDQITDEGVAHLGPSRIIGSLSIHGVQITDRAIGSIVQQFRRPGQIGLQQIDLSHTSIGDTGLRTLMEASSKMPSLRVDVRDTKVTSATVNELRAKYPFPRWLIETDE